MIKDKVIGFVRVSTLKQTLSIKNQVSRIKTYTKDNKLELVDIIKEEGVSGGKINRKGFDQMLELVDNKKIKTKVDKQTLVDNGLAKKKDLVKILGRGELTAKLDITIHSFSKSAKAAIEKAGGTATVSEK